MLTVSQAHRNLYQMAHILHRDVSIGNILINTDKAAKEGDRGILIDLDYAVRLEKLEKGPKTVVCVFSFSHRVHCSSYSFRAREGSCHVIFYKAG